MRVDNFLKFMDICDILNPSSERSKDMDITYRKSGDYYLPNLVAPESPKKSIGLYGQMRRRYLKKHHPAVYSAMKIEGRLLEHLAEIDELCHKESAVRIKALAKSQGITEELKKRDQIRWAGIMNNIQQAVREQVLWEFIYVEEVLK